MGEQRAPGIDAIVPLQTKRLVLRPPDPDAAEIVNSAIRDSFPELSQWLPWADHVPSVDETREHLTNGLARFRAGEEWGLFLWDRESDAYVGAVGVHARLSDPARREIGYWIRTSAAGRGFATEAVRAVSRAALEHLSLAALEIHVHELNVPSQKVALNAGFVYAGEVPGRSEADGRPARMLVYVLEGRRR